MKSSTHILVVEDEAHIAAGLQYNLEAEGYLVTVVGEGPRALELIESQAGEYALVVLDLMLPGMSGYAVCESLRAAEIDVPVLILSARAQAEDRMRGFDVGADQYMTKPFDLGEFLSRVKSLLARHSGRLAGSPPAATCSFGEAEVDFETLQAVVAGETIRLTPLEARLLRHFVANEGRVISRVELLEKVWDLPGNLQTRAPDQFLRRLRKIFEPDPSRPRHFVTIRDAGYRFLLAGEEE